MNDSLLVHTASKPLPDVRIGDVWREIDPRLARYVRIIKLRGDWVVIQTCLSDGGESLQRYALGRTNDAKLSRFNGKRGGYALHHRSDEVTP